VKVSQIPNAIIRRDKRDVLIGLYIMYGCDLEGKSDICFGFEQDVNVAWTRN